MDDERGTRESTAGLGAERIARNQATFREANDRIRTAAEERAFEERVPFVCECADPACQALVRLTLAEYEAVRADPRHFLTAPGHHEASQRWGEIVARRDGHLVVAKVGAAGEIAAELAGAPLLDEAGGDGRRDARA